MSTVTVSINGTTSTATGATERDALIEALYCIHESTTDAELCDDTYRVAVLMSEGDTYWDASTPSIIPRAAAELIADATNCATTVSIDGREGTASPVSLLGLL